MGAGSASVSRSADGAYHCHTVYTSCPNFGQPCRIYAADGYQRRLRGLAGLA